MQELLNRHKKIGKGPAYNEEKHYDKRRKGKIKGSQKAS